MPEGASKGFATASSLIRSSHFNLESIGEASDLHNAQPSRKATGGVGEGSKKAKGRVGRHRSPSGEPTSNITVRKVKGRKKQADKGTGTEGAGVSTLGITEFSHFTKIISKDVDLSGSLETSHTGDAGPKRPRGRKPAVDKAQRAPKTISRTSTPRIVSHTDLTEPQETEMSPKLPNVTSKAKTTKPKSTATKRKTAKRDTEGGVKAKVSKETKAPKAVGATKSRGRVSKNAVEAVSKHFPTVNGAARRGSGSTVAEDESIWDVPAIPTESKQNSGEKGAPPNSDCHLDLEEAVARRRDWTPVKDSNRRNDFTDSSEKENMTVDVNQNKQFTSILSNYAFAEAQLQAPMQLALEPALQPIGTLSEAPTRRQKRKVELIEVPGQGRTSRSASPHKRKVQKKGSARTITDIVTGKYGEEQPDDMTSEKQDLVKPCTAPPTDELSIPILKPSRTRPVTKDKAGKSDTRSKKASAKTAAKPKLVADSLLTPSSASTRLNNQDFLFGTSSQLGNEESPTLLRQIQQAIRESEVDVEPLDGASEEDLYVRRGICTIASLSKREGRRGLWSISTRDEDGVLLKDQNDVYIPEPDRTQDFPLLMDITGNDSSFANIDDFDLPSPKPKGHASAATNASVDSAKPIGTGDISAIPEDNIIHNDEFCGLPSQRQRSRPATPPSINDAFSQKLRLGYIGAATTTTLVTSQRPRLGYVGAATTATLASSQKARPGYVGAATTTALASSQKSRPGYVGAATTTALIASQRLQFGYVGAATTTTLASAQTISTPALTAPPDDILHDSDEGFAEPPPSNQQASPEEFPDINDLLSPSRSLRSVAHAASQASRSGSPVKERERDPFAKKNSATSTRSTASRGNATSQGNASSETGAASGGSDSRRSPISASPTKTSKVQAPPCRTTAFASIPKISEAPAPPRKTTSSTSAPKESKAPAPPRPKSTSVSPLKKTGAAPATCASPTKKSKRPAPAIPDSPPKKSKPSPPSTPRKSNNRFAHIEEIHDSEDDEALSPSPPRNTQRKVSPPLPLALSQPAAPHPELSPTKSADADPTAVFQIPASQLAWADVKDSIFDQITSHIRSLPPSEDPNRPSWHEKILMYDPIVVEDLTAYLAAHTSIRTYRRATKVQIKAWNKKLKAEKRDIFQVDEKGDQVLAVEKEVESWMVQYWCQEHSICCISKEGRSKGGYGKALY